MRCMKQIMIDMGKDNYLGLKELKYNWQEHGELQQTNRTIEDANKKKKLL